MTRTVRVILRNRYTELLPPYPQAELRAAFGFHPDNYWFMSAYKTGRWDGLISKLRYKRVPTGLFIALRKEIAQTLDLRWEIIRDLRSVEFRAVSPSDRQYQNEALATMKLAAGYGGGIVLAGTGTGKTVVAAKFFESLIGTGCFIVDEGALREQTRAVFADVLKEPIGKIGESEFQPARITVATIQSLYLHRKRADYRAWDKKLTALLVDEIHLMLNNSNRKFVDFIKPPVVFGFTATLELQKKPVRYEAFSLAGPVVFRFPLEEATAQGYLTRGVVVQLLINTSLLATQWTTKYTELTTDSRRNALIADTAVAAIKAGRKVVILLERINHIKIISRLLRSSVSYRSIHGAIAIPMRREFIKQFEQGDIDVIIANRVFAKGIDIKSVDFIIDATASSSANNALQRYGRGVRLAAGKSSLIFVDIGDVGNSFETATKARRRAYRREKIQVYQVGVRSTMNINKLITIAAQLGENEKIESSANSVRST